MIVFRCTICGLVGNAKQRYPVCMCFSPYDEIWLPTGKVVRRTKMGIPFVKSPAVPPREVHVVNDHGTILASIVNLGLPGCDCGRCGTVPNGMFICCSGALMAYTNAEIAADGGVRT